MPPDKYYLNLAGEYRVAAELLKREIFATITYGNMKGADIYAIGPNRKTAVVEVKASNSSRFVTGFFQRYKDEAQEHPDFWVLYRWAGDLEAVLRSARTGRLDRVGASLRWRERVR